MNPRLPYCCVIAEWEGFAAEHSRTCPEVRAAEKAATHTAPAGAA